MDLLTKRKDRETTIPILRFFPSWACVFTWFHFVATAVGFRLPLMSCLKSKCRFWSTLKLVWHHLRHCCCIALHLKMKMEFGFKKYDICQIYSRCASSFRVRYTSVTSEQADHSLSHHSAHGSSSICSHRVQHHRSACRRQSEGAQEASLAVSIHYRRGAWPGHYQCGQCSQPLGKRAGFIMGHSALVAPSVSLTVWTREQNSRRRTHQSLPFF